MDAAEAKRISVVGGDMDASETTAGKRERAPVEGAMDSDIPTQSIDKKSRLGCDGAQSPRPAPVMDKEVVKW